jgi:hypothetical protein
MQAAFFHRGTEMEQAIEACRVLGDGRLITRIAGSNPLKLLDKIVYFRLCPVSP